MSYQYQRSYYPKRPVKSFQDLEVYQKSLAVSVVITKRIADENKQSRVEKSDNDSVNGLINNLKHSVVNNLLSCVLAIPMQITTAHSLRFSYGEKAIDNLESAMLNCNKTVVYLEQYRDICSHDIEHSFFEDQMKNLLTTRMKLMHLQRSWKKFMEEK